MLTVVSHLKRVGLIGYENRDSDDTGKKIVYIAPMKALAQEIVEKFSEKLKPLGMVVRELTGDMQLTRAAAEAANILVTTPEKWDGRSTHAHYLLRGLVLLMRSFDLVSIMNNAIINDFNLQLSPGNRGQMKTLLVTNVAC